MAMKRGVQLPPMDGEGSVRHSQSGTGDDIEMPEVEEQIGDDDELEELPEDPREIVRLLEDVQAKQTSMQQPSMRLDALVARAVAGRPELRAKLAVLTKSALLRKKILTIVPAGCRTVGSGALGSTHYWRTRNPDNFTDHNWPKASMSSSGLHVLAGGSVSHDNLLRSPADKIRKNPLLSSPASYTVPKAKRFPRAQEQADRKFEIMSRQNPGPGHYFKSVPRGTAFSSDGGETVVLGANHACPWKSAMGHQINPVDVDFTTGVHAPCFTFPKTRRMVSDPVVGQSMIPVKTDNFNLSPGPVYEHFGSVKPIHGRSHAPNMSMRRSKSVPSISRVRPVRMIPCPPPDEEVTQRSAAA